MNETNGPERTSSLGDGGHSPQGASSSQAVREPNAEGDRPRQNRDALQRERDEYLAVVHQLLAKEVPAMTEEELHDLRTNGVSEEEFLREIDRLFPPARS
jgi:hypothetical protein